MGEERKQGRRKGWRESKRNSRARPSHKGLRSRNKSLKLANFGPLAPLNFWVSSPTTFLKMSPK